MENDTFWDDEQQRNHFRILLYLGIVLFPCFAALDFWVFHQFVSAVIELFLAACFSVALLIVNRGFYIKQSIYMIMFSMLLGALGIMWQDALMIPWIAVVTVIGFGFVGTMRGRQWAALTIASVAMLLVFDGMRQPPLYSPAMGLNLIVSCMTLAFIVDYAYAQLQKKQARLRQETAQKERLALCKRFSENMAHLINNEMLGVMGFAEIIQFEIQNEQIKQHLNNIILSAEKTSQHANQLAAFSGKQAYNNQRFDFQILVESIVQNWKEEMTADIQVRLHWQTDRFSCEGDPVLLKDAILCLLHNAREAIECVQNRDQGVINVYLDSKMLNTMEQGGLRAGKYATLCIEDNGCGIPPSIQDTLFEPFVTTGFLGRGLGLANAQGVIRQHGGEIKLQATGESGSAFKLWLPLVSSVETHA